MPLTGLPIEDPALAARSALVVKIDNHPEARPQSGLNQADIVFEENVEHLTRFAAVFQSQAPDPVGPIRSGRTQDVAAARLAEQADLRLEWRQPGRDRGDQRLRLHRRQRAEQRPPGRRVLPVA